MTDQHGNDPRPPETAAAAAGDSDPVRPPAPAEAGGQGRGSGDREPAQPRLVIRDRRKIRPPGHADAPVAGEASGDAAEPPASADPSVPGGAPAPADGDRTPTDDDRTAPGTAPDDRPAAGAPAGETDPTGGLGAELEALRAELDERTSDLQRVTAEYANYRKRVERDRALVGEQATATVLSALLPVLDDLDRAREHGELVDGFGAVAEQLLTVTGKFGLTAFGEKGDPFDPNRHEAVAHQTSTEVTEPTCVGVLRRGYLLGGRLLRPAMVAVADPE